MKDLIQQTDRLICLVAEYGSADRATCRDAAFVADRLSKTHNLKNLLDQLGNRYALAGGKPIPADIRSAVEEINAFDSSSQTFRYLKSNKGDPFSPTQMHFDLRHLQYALSSALSFFGGMESWIDEQQMSAGDLSDNFAK